MNVRDVLKFPSFEGARVLAGESGLDNVVSSAMVMEAIDIDQRGRRGQLILTSFFAMRDLTAAQLAGLLETMAGMGIAAVVFKVNRLVRDIPASFLAASDRLGVPVIQVSKSCHYEAIMFDVFGSIVDSHVTMLSHYYDMHQRTLALALRRPSHMQVAQFLKQQVRSDVTYADTLHEERVGTDPALAAFESVEFEPVERDRYMSYEYFSATLRYADGSTGHALAVKVPSEHTGERYLFAHGEDWQLRPLDIMVIENVMSALQLEELRRQTETQQRFFEKNGAVHDILMGRLSGADGNLASRLDELGMANFPNYQMLLVGIELTDGAAPYEFGDLMGALTQKIASSYLNVVYYQSNNRVTFLRNCVGNGDGFDPKVVTRLLDSLHDVKALPGFTFTAMLSRLAPADQIATLNSDVINMLKLFGAKHGYDCFFDYEMLGTFKLFLQAADGRGLSDYVDRRVARLYAENAELFRCAVLLCENGLNYSETARQLFLHPKTIHYRVGRLNEVYGIDLKSSDDRLQLLVADKINVLTGGVTPEGTGEA